jgi:hypothetical protein
VPLQVREHVLHRRHAVEQHAGLEAPLGDRAVAVVADAPEVDGVGDDVDRARGEVRGQRDRNVLVEPALPEAEALLVPERPAPELVPRRAVGEQRAELRDVRAQARARERLGEERRLPRARLAQPVDVPGREVGAGLVERRGQQLVRLARQEVVAVHERQQLAGGGVDSGVAGAAEAAVRLADQLEAPVLRGEVLGDRSAAVAGAVVDHDHLQVRERLPRDRLEARPQVPLDVVDRDDDAYAPHRP